MSSKPRILIQLDGDARASVFDAVVAIDAGVEHLLQYSGVTPEIVEPLVHGAMFTRGPQDLSSTAIFIGGSDVSLGERLLSAVTRCFFGPLRASVLLDANGANTTAAAAVLAASRHVPLAGCTATVLAATGPVGQRAVRLLSREGAAEVRVVSRRQERAAAICDRLAERCPQTRLVPQAAADAAQTAEAVDGAQLVIAAGAAGVELLSGEVRRQASQLRVAIDLNAVAPVGIAGIDISAKAEDQDGVICYGALGVGGTKMKIHREAVRQLFSANDLVLDAEQVLEIGKQLA